LPKPMLTICNLPMIDYCIAQASYYKIKNIFLTLAYKPEKIIDWCNGYNGINFEYSVENKPLGTFGGVKKIANKLSEMFFVLSGDGLNDIDLEKMHKSHIKSGADITIAITKSNTPWLFGVVETDNNGMVKSFYEKPTEYKGNTVNTGIYLINKKILNLLPDGNYDFAKDLFPLVLQYGKINTFFHDGYWNDIGNPNSYYDSNFYVKEHSFFCNVKNREYNQIVQLHRDNNLIVSNSIINGEVNNCIVGNRCNVKGNLNNCIVLDDSEVCGNFENCILANNNVIKIE